MIDPSSVRGDFPQETESTASVVDASVAPNVPKEWSSTKALWITALIVYIGVFPLANLVMNSLGVLRFPSYAVPTWYLIFLVLPEICVSVVALFAARGPSRRAGALVIGLLSVAIELAVNAWVFGSPIFGWNPYFMLGNPQSPFAHFAVPVLDLTSSALLFLCWALARPLYGAGYAALPIGIAAQFLMVNMLLPLLYPLFLWSPAQGLISSLLYSVSWAIIALGTIFLARIWSKSSLGRRRVKEARAHKTVPSTPGKAGAAGHLAGGYDVDPRNGVVSSTSGLAIAALIVVFFNSVIGLILGHVALKQIARSGQRGHGLALAAVVIGWISVGLCAGLVVTALVYLSSVGLWS